MKTALLVLALLNFALCETPSKDGSIPNPDQCQPGYTGTKCENPICDYPTHIFSHDGTMDDGEMIFWDFSFRCTQDLYFYIDEFIVNITMTAIGGNAFSATVYKNGTLVKPTITYGTAQGLHVLRYDEISKLYGYGEYFVQIRSDRSESCEFFITAPTTLVVDGGFVVGNRDDNVQWKMPGDHDGVGINPKENISSYYAFKLPAMLDHPAKATQVTAYLIRSLGIPSVVWDRYNCAATEYAGPYTCEPMYGAPYHLMVTGVDTKGNVWQRVYEFECDSTSPQAPTTPGGPVTECYNGGVVVNAGLPTQECYCGQYFEGRQCEIKRCFNGGGVDEISQDCICKIGYSGTYCQNVICDKQTGDYYDLNHRAITFVIRTGRSMIGHIQQIITAANNIANYYDLTEATYVSQWVLITVNNGTVDMSNHDTKARFVDAIRRISNDKDTICDDKLFLAISEYLSTAFPGIYRRSPIFVFADGLPNDDIDTQYRLLHQLSFFRGQVFFMLADSAIGSCKIDMAAPGYRAMRYLAQFSLGHVSHVALEDLNSATFALATTSYRSNVIISNDLIDSCQRAPKYQAFFIDQSMTSFYISATGRGLKVTLIMPDRHSVEPDEFFHSTLDNTYVWVVSPKNIQIGGYFLQLTSTSKDPCSVRVYGSSSTNLWVGVSHSPNEDNINTQPTLKEQSHVVAFIDKISYPTDAPVYAEATIWTNEGLADKRTVLYASGGTFRDKCDFHLYFGAWKCVAAWQFFYMNIYVTTRAGAVVQRTFTGFCSDVTPTKEPPAGCLNGGYPAGLNGTCLCTAHYTGNKCEILKCLNLGTPIGSACLCITGFSGQYCETTTCYYKNREVSFSANGRSLSFIIQDSISTRTTIKNLQQQMPTLIQDLTHQHRDWISNYQLWRFNDSSFENLVSTADPNGFLDGMKRLNNSNAMSSDPSCKDLTVLPGLIQLLLHEGLTYNGVVYLFLNGYMKVDSTAQNQVQAVYEMLEKTGVQLNVVLMSGSPCGQDLSDPPSTTLMNFASFTGGQFIMVMPSKAGNVARSIPTQYRSSFVYENYAENCTNTQTFYFPVDSQMQSFTAYIVGELDDQALKYYQPNGSEKAPFNIWMEYGLGTRLDQIIQACDDGWELRDNRCWFFSVLKKTWVDAQTQCHQNGAVLLTILNAGEQKYVDDLVKDIYWTGLNDRITSEVWVWDTLSGNPLSLDSTGFKNWAAGQPVISDLSKRCVSGHRSVGWAVDDCATTARIFACVKHAYNADYEPVSSTVGDLLQRGIWKLRVRTTDGPCYVQIFGQSGIQQYTTFTTDIHSDYGTPQPLANAADNKIVAHMENQQSVGAGVSGTLEYAHFYQYNMTIVQAQVFQKRNPNGCSYEYLSSNFKCPSSNFLALTTGVDRFGYLYQRIQPVSCYKGPQPGACINGVYYSGHCYCDPNYTGDLCEKPICQHGTPDSVGEHCNCYNGYMEAVCNIPICKRQTTKPPVEPTPTNRTFILLLDGSKTGEMQYTAPEMQIVLNNVSQTLIKYPGWFTHFTGLVFRDSSAAIPLSDVIESNDFATFATKILAEANKPYTPTVQKRSIMAAVIKVLKSTFIQPRSFVWIITASVPEDYTSLTPAMNSVAREHCYVNFLIIGDTKPPGSAQYTDASFGAMFELIVSSGGQYYQVSSDSGRLGSFWTGLFSNYYNAYAISTVQKLNCSGGFTEYVQMGSNTSTLIIDAVGMGQVNLFDPAGNKMAVYTAAQSKINVVQVASGYGSRPGLWKVQVPTYNGFCRLVIRGQSTLDVYIAFTYDTGSDGGLHSNEADFFPAAGSVENAVVAFSNFGKLNFAQIFTPDERTLIWSSPMIRRQQCTYNYVSKNVFACTLPWFALAIDGEDDNGFAFRRMVHVHCIGTIATTPSLPANFTTFNPPTIGALSTLPPPVCNYTAPYDVIIMFDASGSVTVTEYTTIVQALIGIAYQIPIAQNRTRIMLGTYTDYASMFTPDFTTIQNADDFLVQLGILREHGHSGEMANNVQSIFDLINPSWWRPEAEQILVFFSSMGWDQSGSGTLYPDPTAAAKAFVKGGGKLIPIGYGQNANEQQLKAMGTTCTKMAANLEVLDYVIIPWVTSAICNPDPYCTT